MISVTQLMISINTLTSIGVPVALTASGTTEYNLIQIYKFKRNKIVFINDSKLNIQLKVSIFLLIHVQFRLLLLHVVTVIVMI